MGGYSLTASFVFFIMLASASEVHNVSSISLPTIKITADRTSPAFSALEDALSIQKLTVEKEKVNLQAPLKLKGLKVSAKPKTPLKIEKINLMGERIGVAHFTEKFINKSKKLKLAAISSRPQLSLSQARRHLVKKKLVVEGVTIENLSSAVKKEKQQQLPVISISSRSNNVVNVKKVELAKPSLKIKDAESFVSTSPVRASVYEAVQLSGNLNLEDESEISGENLAYYISRSFDGQLYETGVVDVENPKFQMELGSLKGLLLVELRTEEGEVLAYGEHKLSSDSNLNDLEVKVYPSQSLFSGRALSAKDSTSGAEVAVESALEKVSGVEGSLKVDRDGYYNEVLFEKGSSYVVETSSKDYWTDLKFGVAGKALYPRLIRKDAFENFAKTLDPYGEPVDVQNAIVGSVTQKGLSLENIKISLLGNEHQKPVYFNDKGAPDPLLNKTSTNGGFIFVNIPNGVHLVQAVRGNEVLSQKWYMAKDGRLSQGQINVDKRGSLITLIENFPRRDQAEVFSLQELGIDDTYSVSADTKSLINLKTNSEILGLLINESDKYKPHIYITSSKARRKKLKTIQTKWIELFLNSRRSNANRAMGTVVGFIGKNSFKVVKETTTALSSSSQIFYFDKNGDHTETGVAGGGFLITDVPYGLKSVVVAVKGRDTFLNKVVLSQERSISVF